MKHGNTDKEHCDPIHPSDTGTGGTRRDPRRGSADGHRVISDAFYRDRWTALSQVILCGIGLATSLVAWEHVARPRDDHIAEFFSLLLASAAGMAFFVGSANLMVMFLSLEWFSLALYVMCAIDYDVEG